MAEALPAPTLLYKLVLYRTCTSVSACSPSVRCPCMTMDGCMLPCINNKICGSPSAHQVAVTLRDQEDCRIRRVQESALQRWPRKARFRHRECIIMHKICSRQRACKQSCSRAGSRMHELPRASAGPNLVQGLHGRQRAVAAIAREASAVRCEVQVHAVHVHDRKVAAVRAAHLWGSHHNCDLMWQENTALVGTFIMQGLHAWVGMMRVHAGRRISPGWLDDM